MIVYATPKWIREQVRRIIVGYPPAAIIRELIQNADDAKATWFQAELFDKPSTPKLRALLEPNQPFLLVSNDGPFCPEHRRAISSVLMSAKPEGGGANDIPPIGKFGAGLKSVFSLCEAFFGFHPPFRDTETHADGPPGFEVIPGMPETKNAADSGDGFSIELTKRWWELINAPDEMKKLYAEIKTLAFSGLSIEGGQLAPQTPHEQHLILLIPLRQDVGYPLKHWKYTSTPQSGWVSVQDLWKEVVAEDWDRLWPLLIGAANLQTIRLVHNNKVRGSKIQEPTQRPRRPYDSVQPGARVGSSPIDTEARDHTRSEPLPQNYAFAAFPGELVDPSAPRLPPDSDSDRSALVNLDTWPRVEPKGQNEPNPKQKLPAESAVWIYGISAKPLAAEARWACGLPLAGWNPNFEAVSNQCGRSAPLQVVLHGTFQPDESRTSLVLTDFGGQWNRWLIRRTLGLLPSAVYQFIKDDAPIEASLKIDAIAEGLREIRSPSVKEVEKVCKSAFWKVVCAHQAVLPMLSPKADKLHIDYRLHEGTKIGETRILPIPLTNRKTDHSGTDTLDPLSAALAELSLALPGVRAAVSRREVFAVQTADSDKKHKLSMFPPSSDQSRWSKWTPNWSTWTPAQIRELRSPETKGHEQFALGVLLALAPQKSAEDAFHDPETKRWVIRLITSRVKSVVEDELRPARGAAHQHTLAEDMKTIQELAKRVQLSLVYTPARVSADLSLKLIEASAATDQTYLVLPSELKLSELESPGQMQPPIAPSGLPSDVADSLRVRLAGAALAWAHGEAIPTMPSDELHGVCEGLYTVLRWLMPENPSAALPDWWLKLPDADKTVRMLVACLAKTAQRVSDDADPFASEPKLLKFLDQGQVVGLQKDLPPEVAEAVFTEQVTHIAALPLVFVPASWTNGQASKKERPTAASWLWTFATSATCRDKYTKVSHFEALFKTIHILLGTVCEQPTPAHPVPLWTRGAWTWVRDGFSTAEPSLTIFRAGRHSEKLFKAVEEVFHHQVGFVPASSADVLGMKTTPMADSAGLSSWMAGPTFSGIFTTDLEARWKLFEIMTGKGNSE